MMTESDAALSRGLMREYEPRAFQICSHFLARTGMRYLRERLDYDASEFGSLRLLTDLWLKPLQGNHVHLIEFYQEAYGDRAEPRLESLIDTFLISLVATILGEIAAKEYEVRRDQIAQAVQTMYQRCRSALSYLLDMYALKDMRMRKIINDEEYGSLTTRLGARLRGGEVRDDAWERVTLTLKPFYAQFGFSSSAEVLDALDDETRSKESALQDKEIGANPRRLLSNSIRGIPASPGIAEGILKIVWESEDGKKIKEGDIGGFFYYAPELVPALRRTRGAFGIGGITGHLAIVSRALGIPAVTGVLADTKGEDYVSISGYRYEMTDGDYVIVDGYGGKVHILKR